MPPGMTNAVPYPDCTVMITWSDHSLRRRRDATWFVRKMRILPDGIGLAWPNEINLAMDGLRQRASPHEQTGSFTALVAADWVAWIRRPEKA